VENLGLVFADKGGVPEGFQDDQAVQVPPRSEEESGRSSSSPATR
jgi:hypothetical protein